VKHACIGRLRDEFPVRLMCRLLGVSPAGFYKARQRGLSARATADQRLRLAIRAEHAASHQRYGAPKIHAALRAQGVDCGRHRVARLMREDGLAARRARKFVRTTDSAHAEPIAPTAAATKVTPSHAASPSADCRRVKVWCRCTLILLKPSTARRPAPDRTRVEMHYPLGAYSCAGRFQAASAMRRAASVKLTGPVLITRW